MTQFNHGDKVLVPGTIHAWASSPPSPDMGLDVRINLRPQSTYGDGGIEIPLAELTDGITLVEAPTDPYKPREGDEVEVTVRGTLCERYLGRGTGWIVELTFGDEMRRFHVGQSVWDEGRVRLVKAAAPVFEPGRIYRSRATSETFLYAPSGCAGATAFWYPLGGNGDMWLTETEVPADLEPMDLVPAVAS